MLEFMDDGSMVINFDWAQLKWWHAFFITIPYGLITQWVSACEVNEWNEARLGAFNSTKKVDTSDMVIMMLLRMTGSLPFRLFAMTFGVVMFVVWTIGKLAYGLGARIATFKKPDKEWDWKAPRKVFGFGWQWKLSPEQIQKELG